MAHDPPSEHAGEREAADLPERLDHTLLKPEATRELIEAVAAEALEWGMAAAVVLPHWLPLVARMLEGSPVAACSVVGFPLGHEAPAVLEHSARRLVAAGARELDMVLSVGALLSGHDREVARQIEAVVRGGRAEYRECLIKVITETHLLDDQALGRGCRLVREQGADFVKTATGFTGGKATPHQVRRLRALAGEHLRIKASGGIRTLAQAEELLAAGADRLGTSAGADIARAWRRNKERHAAF